MQYSQGTPSPSSMSNTDQSMNILLVDANTGRATHTLLALRRLQPSLKGLVAESCRIAAGMLRDQDFDCAVVHQSTADHDGSWPINALRNPEDLRPLPIVVIAANTEYSDALLALRSGAADFLAERTLTPEVLLESLSVVVYRDGIDRAALEQALALEQQNLNLERRQRHLAEAQGTMAHDLLTPLAAINEYLSMVLDGLAGDYSDTQGRFLAVARGRCADIQTKIESMVAVADGSTVLTASEGPVLVEQLIIDVLDRFSLQAAVNGVHFGYAIDSGIRYVKADELLLQEAVINLLYRLMGACSPSGSVLVLAERDPDQKNHVRLVLRAQVNLLPEQMTRDRGTAPADEDISSAALRYLADGLLLEQRVDNDLEFSISLPVINGPALETLRNRPTGIQHSRSHG